MALLVRDVVDHGVPGRLERAAQGHTKLCQNVQHISPTFTVVYYGVCEWGRPTEQHWIIINSRIFVLQCHSVTFLLLNYRAATIYQS